MGVHWKKRTRIAFICSFNKYLLSIYYIPGEQGRSGPYPDEAHNLLRVLGHLCLAYTSDFSSSLPFAFHLLNTILGPREDTCCVGPLFSHFPSLSGMFWDLWVWLLPLLFFSKYPCLMMLSSSWAPLGKSSIPKRNNSKMLYWNLTEFSCI